MFEQERRRGHRYAGTLEPRGRERHWAIAGAIAAIVGAAAAGYSTYAQYAAQSQAASYNKAVAKNQAQASRDAAAIAYQNRQTELRHIMGAQRARLGASGVEASEGSPLLVQIESANQAELDLARITYAGKTRAQGYTSQAILQGYYGSKAQQAANTGAGTSLLSGASPTIKALSTYQGSAE